MERIEAQKKAKEMWGEKAFVAVAPNCFLVGEYDEIFQHIYGAGVTWELAFYNAHINLN
jgi:hypothetical protein